MSKTPDRTKTRLYMALGRIDGQAPDLCSVRATNLSQAVTRARRVLRERHEEVAGPSRTRARVHIDACVAARPAEAA